MHKYNFDIPVIPTFSKKTKLIVFLTVFTSVLAMNVLCRLFSLNFWLNWE
uniref:Uncharacterized protein n=1 Tax=Anguilla anguilla TaxID=7936 RepID=A0A0E9WXX6_ANGAN